MLNITGEKENTQMRREREAHHIHKPPLRLDVNHTHCVATEKFKYAHMPFNMNQKNPKQMEGQLETRSFQKEPFTNRSGYVYCF